ncbi:MAG: hypothetical protein DVB26_04355, partial [Verrucomicrobia bacterium]
MQKSRFPAAFLAALAPDPTTPRTGRWLRMIFGLALAVLGLGAPIASAGTTTIPVTNGSFETTYGGSTATYWYHLNAANGWTPSTDSAYAAYNIGDSVGIGYPANNAAFAAAANGKYAVNLFGVKNITQDMGTQTFNAGDQLSVSFSGGFPNAGGTVKGGLFYAKFIINGVTYTSSAYDTTNNTGGSGSWQTFTFTQTIPANVTGTFQIQFSVDQTLTYRPWLDNVSNVTVTSVGGSTPTITTSGTLAAVSTTYGTASATPSSFTVSGANMTAGITVTPPAGFEVSQTVGGASGYAGSGTAITVGSSGTIASTTVYVRLAATATVGSSPYSGNITCVSSDATTQNVATVSSTVSKATPTATLTVDNSPVTFDGSPKAATVTLSASSVAGSVQNILTGGAATQTASNTYAVTGDFVPTDTANYNSLTGLAAGNFVINPAAQTYASWASTNGVTGGPSYVGNDGLSNLLVYALDLKLNGGNGSA